MRWRPGPGWLLVKRVETEETFGGSSIVIPVQARDDVTRLQVEAIAVARDGAYCGDRDCERRHDDAGRHPVPFGLEAGSWCLLKPRSLVQGPDDWTYVVAMDDVMAILGG